MLRFNFNNSDVEVVQAFDIKGEKLIGALVEKMSLLMTKLQERAREQLDETESSKQKQENSGALRDSITNPQAHAEGGTIIGTLDWGGGIPYARIQEFGGLKPYVINPIGRESIGGRGLGGSRKRVKGAVRRFGANKLRFMGARDGRIVYSPSVFKKVPLKARHFMSGALEEMRSEIVAGLRETIQGVMREKRF